MRIPVRSTGIRMLTVIRDNLMDTLYVNVNSVHLVNKTFLPLLRKGQKKTVMSLCVPQLLDF